MERIIVEGVFKKFKIGFQKNQNVLARFYSLFSGREPKKIIEVLKNVSLRVNSGEILGIVGNNGCGKSTLLRSIAGIYKIDGGRIILKGRVVSLINLHAGLKERLTMKENIFLIGSFFGLGQKDIKDKFNSIVKFSGLEKFLNTKIYQFSEGMKQRLFFSIAINSNPDILLLDEVFEVGDESFREKSASKIKELVGRGSCAVVVSHDKEIISKYADRVISLSK